MGVKCLLYRRKAANSTSTLLRQLYDYTSIESSVCSSPLDLAHRPSMQTLLLQEHTPPPPHTPPLRAPPRSVMTVIDMSGWCACRWWEFYSSLVIVNPPLGTVHVTSEPSHGDQPQIPHSLCPRHGQNKSDLPSGSLEDWRLQHHQRGKYNFGHTLGTPHPTILNSDFNVVHGIECRLSNLVSGGVIILKLLYYKLYKNNFQQCIIKQAMSFLQCMNKKMNSKSYIFKCWPYIEALETFKDVLL